MLFNIFGEEFELDTLDYDQMLKVEQECENVTGRITAIRDKALSEGMRQSELVKEATEIIANFFDEAIGIGTAERIMKGKINYGLALEAFGEFIAQKNAGSGAAIRAINDKYLAKIKPARPHSDSDSIAIPNTGNPGNRQQRRQASKKNYPNKKYNK